MKNALHWNNGRQATSLI